MFHTCVNINVFAFIWNKIKQNKQNKMLGMPFKDFYGYQIRYTTKSNIVDFLSIKNRIYRLIYRKWIIKNSFVKRPNYNTDIFQIFLLKFYTCIHNLLQDQLTCEGKLSTSNSVAGTYVCYIDMNMVWFFRLHIWKLIHIWYVLWIFTSDNILVLLKLNVS